MLWYFMATTENRTAKGGLDSMTLMAMAKAAEGDTGSAAPSGMSTLFKLLERKLAKEMEEEDRKEEELRRLLQARSESFKQEIAGRQAAMSACSHRKEDNRSAVGGQRLSNGTVLFICQHCGHTWNGSELPPSLHINGELIGG